MQWQVCADIEMLTRLLPHFQMLVGQFRGSVTKYGHELQPQKQSLLPINCWRLE
jgi:hypothetical protein